MEYDKIKQLMEDMGNSKLTSIDIEFPDGIKIKMEKKEKEVIVKTQSEEVIERKVQNVEENAVENSVEVKENNEEDFDIIKSPMIGTFYIKPSPDSEPYVQEGVVVKKGDIVCIIEAMKLMNEIESEYNGKILEILVKDGEAVDYGKPLFKVSKN